MNHPLPVFFWGHSRRFNSYSEYIRNIFGGRIQKLSIDAGFTCPNRDGTLGYGGCIFCNNEAFNPSYCSAQKPVRQQLEEGIAFHKVRYRRAQGYLAYFQAFSNTHAPLGRLKTLYSEALSFPGVRGLVIGTRPDCLDEPILDYLAELAQQYFISVEIGIESCYDSTLAWMRRGHGFEQAVRALEQCKIRSLTTGAHFILGLPGETEEMMLESATIVSKLPLTFIKLHQLQVLENTDLADMYRSDPHDFRLFGLNEYIGFVIRYIERLNPAFVIERFTAETPPRYLITPNWGLLRTDQILAMIEQRLSELDTWQGKYFKMY